MQEDRACGLTLLDEFGFAVDFGHGENYKEKLSAVSYQLSAKKTIFQSALWLRDDSFSHPRFDRFTQLAQTSFKKVIGGFYEH